MKKIVLVTLWIGFFMLAGAEVSASVYLEQTDGSQVFNPYQPAGYGTLGNNPAHQSLGTNLSGTISRVTFKLSVTESYSMFYKARLSCFTNETFNVSCGVWHSATTTIETPYPTDFDFIFSNVPAFNSSYYYWISVSPVTPISNCSQWVNGYIGICSNYGSLNDTGYTAGSCQLAGYGSFACQILHDWYFKLYKADIEENDIDFTAPIGGYPTSNYLPHWIGDVDSATSTIWNFIEIEVSRHLTNATSTVISTFSFTKLLALEPNKENQPFDLVDTALPDACYSYRARLGAQYGGLPPEELYLNYSNWFMDNWIFCSGTASIYLPPAIPSKEGYTFQTADFGWLGNMFRDVLIWLFIPKQTTIENYANLKTILVTKAPFGYFYTIKNALTNLNASSTPAFVLASTGEINNSIFQPLKVGLSWILWLFFAFWFIRRIGAFIF